MSGAWPSVQLGEVLATDTRYIDAPEDRIYPKLSVKLYGRGVTLDTPADGAALKMQRHQLARSGQVILSEIWGKKGAIGLVPPEGDGSLCTSHFFLFNVREDRVERGWLRAIFTANYLEPQLNAEAKGTTGYAAVRPKHLLAATIPLPPLAEQRWIVARLDALAAKIEEAKGLNKAAVSETAFVRTMILKECYQTNQSGRVGDHVSVQSGYAFKSEWFTSEGVRLARNVNVGHGHLHWTEAARIPESRRVEFPNFDLREGDILVSLDRPIISTGVKVARVRDCDLPALLLQRVGRARFRDSLVSPEFFFGWLRSPWFVGAIDPGRSNGVPHISPGDIERIPFSPPPLADQLKAVERAAALESALAGVRERQHESGAEIGALIPSVLNRAFAGAL